MTRTENGMVNAKIKKIRKTYIGLLVIITIVMGISVGYAVGISIELENMRETIINSEDVPYKLKLKFMNLNDKEEKC